MPEILIAEEHYQVYQVWLERGVRDIAVVHIDFHCDMRGLLINRRREVAYWTSKHEAEFIDDGNFMSHAIMNGIVSSIRWVHDTHGGRRHDFGGTVKYESDITSSVHELLHRMKGELAPSIMNINTVTKTFTLIKLHFSRPLSDLPPGHT